MTDFPWGVVTILGAGLLFTCYCIYYILKLAHEEMKDEHNITEGSNPKSSQELR
jgi:hypothetical protein